MRLNPFCFTYVSSCRCNYKSQKFEDSFELADNLERLNLYRDDSWYTDKKQSKPFCYCGKREESA